MKLQNVGTVIATRQLDLADGRKVTVTIGKPEKFPDGVNYYCPYQITGIKRDKVRHSGGVDAVQALELALKMIGADLYTSDEAQAGMLSWEGGSKKGDFGFPGPLMSTEFREGEIYYRLTFADPGMLYPKVEAFVFVGKNLCPPYYSPPLGAVY